MGTNPVPMTETTDDTVPVRKVDGVKLVITGEGLSTSRFTAVPPALVAPPLTTMIARFAPDVNKLAGTAAVNCVALT